VPNPPIPSTQTPAVSASNHLQRLPTWQRLLNADDYQRVFNGQPWKSSDAYLTLLAIANSHQYARLGLVIMKKRVKHAVQRNRIKRVVRESFRQHKIQLSGLDLVVLAKDKTAQYDNAILFASLQKHWQRLVRLHHKAAFSSTDSSN